MRRLRLLVLLALLPVTAEGEPLALGDRQYHVAIPDGWDGTSSLPVLMHFHGYGRNGGQVLRNNRVRGAAQDNMALLVAPDSRGRSFDFWQAGSDDSDFADAVIDDLAKRLPLDSERIFVSGFSWGGAMAWRLACERGSRYRGYLPIAGHLYNQTSERCAAGPINIVHVHGLADTVVDPEPGVADDPSRAIAVWHGINGCNSDPERQWTTGRFTCQQWSCGSGKTTRVCLHPGGHVIPKDWLSATLGELLHSSRTGALD